MTNRLEVINKYMAYTYHLYHKPTKKHYYGVRYANNASPAELGVTYFSSSKEIKALIEKYGQDSFVYSVRRIFDNPNDAILWETKFLNRIDAKNNPSWINQHNGDGKFSSYGEMPLHQRQQISKAKQGKQSRGIGWHHSANTVEKIKQNNLGKNTGPISTAHRQQISEGMKATLSNLTAEEKQQRMLNSCCSPESYTQERSQRISKALTGQSKSKIHRANLSKAKKDMISKMSDSEKKDRFGYNKGKTWRVVDGKRKYFNKGEQDDTET